MNMDNQDIVELVEETENSGLTIAERFQARLKMLHEQKRAYSHNKSKPQNQSHPKQKTTFHGIVNKKRNETENC